jgi:hypothetical protein
MLVHGWKNGRFDGRRPVALGVTVGQQFAEMFFDRSWDAVLVEIDGNAFRVKITNTFWTTCPELRSPEIGAWLRNKGLAPWPKGRPPELRLSPVGIRRFRLDT